MCHRYRDFKKLLQQVCDRKTPDAARHAADLLMLVCLINKLSILLMWHQSIQSTNSKDPGSCNVVDLLKYEVVAQAAISCDFAVHALLSWISCLDGVFF
jgi:hypothetical protein